MDSPVGKIRDFLFLFSFGVFNLGFVGRHDDQSIRQCKNVESSKNDQDLTNEGGDES